MNSETLVLPTPHRDKIEALLENRRLPSDDRGQVEEALRRYRDWISEIETVGRGQQDAIQRLVEATNRYRNFIDLDLVFDSRQDFLYRQKGQLKLDNTIIEEFLPHLFYRGLSLGDDIFELGPRQTFAGLSFASSLVEPGSGGHPRFRTKNQDFILGKRLYMMLSFDKDFREAERVNSYLGYVCAECKINLDKTMFQEAVATSRDLKTAVPSSLYFLVCEFLDMTPVPLAATHIDDVLIVRKAKRMSANLRQEFRTADERQARRDEYVHFLRASEYCADVFQRMIDKIKLALDMSAPKTDDVLDRGHF